MAAAAAFAQGRDGGLTVTALLRRVMVGSTEVRCGWAVR
jgi:hypothetical protein